MNHTQSACHQSKGSKFIFLPILPVGIAVTANPRLSLLPEAASHTPSLPTGIGGAIVSHAWTG